VQTSSWNQDSFAAIGEKAGLGILVEKKTV